MGGPIDELVGLLTMAQVADGRFESPSIETGHPRLYGGQLVAQALMAAGLTVDAGRPVNSIHAYFLKAGQATAPISFTVETLRDSGTFSTRRVVAHQFERSLLSFEASFHDPEVGHEDLEAPPDVPGPDDMVATDDWELAGEVPDEHIPHFVDAVETRQLPAAIGGPGRPWPSGLRQPHRDMWIRTRGELPDDSLVHACVLAYASDKPMLGTTALSPPLRDDPRPHLLASLDHSMWFQRPFRVDDWLLVRLTSSTPAGGRAFATAEVHRRDGARAVRVTQEGLARPLPVAD
jgi:acyl-CoA thioesterase-2